ncbi:hypothetical protein [Chitinophaga sp.]|nr:hypothetical protein [Chitinophaga sp.]HWV68962.1 hypothetical protein [Chitinophaga sp.]
MRCAGDSIHPFQAGKTPACLEKGRGATTIPAAISFLFPLNAATS